MTLDLEAARRWAAEASTRTERQLAHTILALVEEVERLRGEWDSLNDLRIGEKNRAYAWQQMAEQLADAIRQIIAATDDPDQPGETQRLADVTQIGDYALAAFDTMKVGM
jgi:hypothetical protein